MLCYLIDIGYIVGLNSVCREIVSYVTIVFYDKVQGRNKALTSFGLLWIFHLKKIQSDTFSQDNSYIVIISCV